MSFGSSSKKLKTNRISSSSIINDNKKNFFIEIKRMSRFIFLTSFLYYPFRL